MGGVGLIYVGAVLFVNGVMLLGRITPRAVAPLNLFVGLLQVLTPVILIVQAGQTQPPGVFAASGLFLFGFTYLWVGINGLADLPGHGLGWFSLFVAVCAVAYAAHALLRENDPTFAVIWLLWAVLWSLFFVLLALDKPSIGPAVGVVAIVEGFVTAAIPGWLIVSGLWREGPLTLTFIVVTGLLGLVLARPLGTRLAPRPSPDPPRSVRHA